MNNPPPDASASVGKFPRTNKQMDQLQKQLPDDAQQQGEFLSQMLLATESSARDFFLASGCL